MQGIVRYCNWPQIWVTDRGVVLLLESLHPASLCLDSPEHKLIRFDWVSCAGLTNVPMDLSMSASRTEFEQIAFSAVKDLLNKTGVQPRQIGIIITNSSLFNTTPSLSATIMNHFKMSSKTLNYNLAGMGCSAGVIAVDLARQMLQLYPDSYALVVSTENLTYNWYPGTNKGMLMTNTLFRVGGAAILLSNKRKETW